MTTQKKYLVAYIPVVHRGYVDWLKKHQGVSVLLLDTSITQQYRPLQKDIRALQPDQIAKSLLALGLTESVEIVSESQLLALPSGTDIMSADELIMRDVAKKYLSHCTITFEPIWLRWDAASATKEQPVVEGETIAASQIQSWLNQAEARAQQSADWWRQVGALAIKDGKVLLQTSNQHLPSEQQPYIDGDPRAEFHKGEKIELSTALHAEASIIAQAAQSGISLAGSSMLVTTFPCPNCAKLIAASGIREVWFKEGYAMLDGERVLRASGVIIRRITE